MKSKQKVHLIIPCGGAGRRFVEKGVCVIKPLIPLFGKPFFYWAAKSVLNCKDFDVKDITFVMLKEHNERYGFADKVKTYFPSANIVELPCQLSGPVYTAMMGALSIKDDTAVIFQDCDHAMVLDDVSVIKHADAAVATFKSNNPQYGYLLHMDGDETKNVCGVVEKETVSENALFGLYYFKSKNLFLNTATLYLDSVRRNYGQEAVMSGVVNYLTQNSDNIYSFKTKEHFEFGTFEEFENLKNTIDEDELKRKLGV